MQAAPTDLAVLITGETGTGKEVFANAIHGLSKRKKLPFVSVNCAAIPETLLESELFGHEKGAFTGATDQRKGFFEVANKGTIFLDEIGEMPYSTQVKLLRVLESGEFSRLGSSDVKRVDVRIIAATNRDLQYEVKNNNFRQDLFFRLKSVHIMLPPLREHLEDIPLLVDYFGKRVTEKIAIKWDGISQDAINVLKALPWQGNIRELKNLIETLITLEQTSYITTEHLRRYIPPALPSADLNPTALDKSLVQIHQFEEPKKFELELIFRTLLEMKNEISELNRNFRNISLAVEDLRQCVIDSNIETVTAVEDNVQYDKGESDLNLEEIEKKAILIALERYDGNRRLAAKTLGISERTLYRKLTQYGIDL